MMAFTKAGIAGFSDMTADLSLAARISSFDTTSVSFWRFCRTAS
jgi:hypothetical protein